MNRRDLLLLRPTARAKVFELSCERLYMQYLDIQRPADPASVPSDEQFDHWLGEPEPRFEQRTARDLFEGLARELAAADVVRVIGQDWLADATLKAEVDRLLSAVTGRGGRVEVVRPS